MIVAQSDDLFVVDIWISNLIPIPPTTPHLWPPTRFEYVLRVSSKDIKVLLSIECLMSPWYMRMMKSLKLTRWSLQPQVHSCSLKSILEIYLLFILRFILIACQQVDTKDLKWILGHNYAPVSATWAIKYAPVYYTGLFWIRGHPTVQTAHCAVETQWIERGIYLLNCLHVLHNV